MLIPFMCAWSIPYSLFQSSSRGEDKWSRKCSIGDHAAFDGVVSLPAAVPFGLRLDDSRWDGTETLVTSRNEQQLSGGAARFQKAMSLRCLGQWKPAADRHAQFALALESEHVVEGASVMIRERIHHGHGEATDLHGLAEQFER